MKYFETDEEGNFTISELVGKMDEFLIEMGSKMDSYSNKHMKFKMVEKFGHELVLTSSEGQSCVVNLKNNVQNIINNLRIRVSELSNFTENDGWFVFRYHFYCFGK